MKHTSFAGRLSGKIILITFVIFFVAILLIAIRGGLVVKEASIYYTAQMLQSSCKGIESKFHVVESTAQTLSRTLDAFNHDNSQLDTACYFPLLADLVTSNPQILGCGAYFEPYTFNKKSKVSGVYVNMTPESGNIEYEWDDDETYDMDGWDYFEADWYREAFDSGKPVWLPPFIEYMVTTDYRYMTSYAVPLKDKKGKAYGVCAFDISLDWLKDELIGMKPYPSSDVVILDKDGQYICNPLSDKPYEGSIYESELFKGYGLSGNILTALDWTDFDDVGAKSRSFRKQKMLCVARTLENGWIMLVFNQNKEAFASVTSLWLLHTLIALLGSVVLFFLSRRIIRKEAQPLVSFAEAAGKITNGHFDVPIPEARHKDEISELGNALRYMQTSVTEYIEKLKVTTSEKERLISELNVARNIQMQMLSTDFPKLKASSIFATNIPARQVGGDLYDFKIQGENLYFIVADVSGKGVPAALLMSISISAFRAATRNEHSMDEIAAIINRVFCRSNNDMMFITVVVGRINSRTGQMDICNAGHNPLVLITPGGETSFLRLKSNLACGLMEDFTFEQQSMTLDKGSRLIVYTDGVTEAENVKHEQFGDDRLLEFASHCGTAGKKSDQQVVFELKASVNKFMDGAEQFDDITIMSVTV